MFSWTWLPVLLDNQFVWLSMTVWAVLLLWLWPRASRRRARSWMLLAIALHVEPLVAIWLHSEPALTPLASSVPLHWALQASNVAAFLILAWILLSARWRGRRHRLPESVLAERRRISSDLHDGVGANLVALLASQHPRTELAMALQLCLLELQMTVDALDDLPDATLSERLGHLRYRMQPAFDRLEILLVREVQSTISVHPLASAAVMNVCKIVQEALSNSLRHSNANRVEVRVRTLGALRGLVLQVSDDGQGFGKKFDALPIGTGKGLRSIRSRVEALHGKMAISNISPHGVSIRIFLPAINFF